MLSHDFLFYLYAINDVLTTYYFMQTFNKFILNLKCKIG